MTYLKSPADLAASIGATSGGSAPMPNDARFLSLLDSCMSKIEAALETPLARATYTDRFRIGPNFSRSNVLLRTHAAFLDTATVVVTGPDGLPINSLNFVVNAEKGTILLDYPERGAYIVTYVAGFAADDSKVYLNTPAALRALLDAFAMHYQRAFRASVTDKIPLAQVLAPVYREIHALAYARFQRPRTCLIEAFQSDAVYGA